MDTTAFLAFCHTQPWYMEQQVHLEALPAHPATLGPLGRPLHARLEAALAALGITGFYSHQAAAINTLAQGRHVIVATPAASGKSLCYHVPVLEALLEDRQARALYLYPTKALTQDQLRWLRGIAAQGSLPLRAATFDGDTPSEERAEVRRSAQIVLSNPDMLHLGILPNHASWARFFSNLRFVVLDEAHVYRGVFGSHVANVLRRLRRVCSLYGSAPQFVLCSATIANPAEHAQRLTGLPTVAIEASGAPSGGKDFVFWNPPIVDQAKGSRRSTNFEATMLFAELLRQGVRTLAFCRTRRMTELLYKYVHQHLKQESAMLASRVKPYRAGYLPEDRRRLERDLFSGQLLGLSATNALELGIDIGNLDATLLAGYPGSIASTWQQAGRSGRRAERSLSVLIAASNPLDQYLMHHPEDFFGKSHEQALISPQNPYILKPHLLCAAYEQPLSSKDALVFGDDLPAQVHELEEEGLMRHRNGRWFLVPSIPYPAERVSLRSTSSETFAVVEKSSGVILETVEYGAALLQLHPGAVYLHQGETYVVGRLDLEGKTAYVEASEVNYYTQTQDLTDLRLLKTLKEKQAGRTRVYLGQVEVSTHVLGYKRKVQLTDEVLGEEYLDLPSLSFTTIALWYDIPDALIMELGRRGLHLPGGLHAAEHASIGILPLFALCDRNDIGGVSTPVHPDTGRAQVFIYDGHPGGIGITEKGYEQIEELWQATLKVIRECPCEEGCPACIHSPKCGNNNEPLDKHAAQLILQWLLGTY